METSIQLLMYIIAFLIQQAKTNRVGFEGVRVKAMTHKDKRNVEEDFMLWTADAERSK